LKGYRQLFAKFLGKYTRKKTTNESTLKKTYLLDAFNDIMKSIALGLKDKYFYIVVDETTASLRLFGEYHFKDKLLLMTSDAAPYMVKAFKSLQIFYSNIIHVTGIVHSLNRIAEKVTMSSCQHFKVRLLPNPVVTRWGTSTNFYSDNFVKFKEVMQNLEEDAASITKVEALLSETEIVKELAVIKSYIEFFPDVMEALETRGMTLKDQLGKLSFVEEKLKIVPVLQQKFENVFENNSGLIYK
ncbi:hypothetical protein ILUMI_27477, partial [Ignelater luminosus]